MPPFGAPYRRRTRRSAPFVLPLLGPSVSVKVGSFVKTTAPEPVLQTISGLGFVPKAVILWTSGGNSNGALQTQATANARMFIGFAAGTGPSEQVTMAATALTAGTTGRRAGRNAVMFIGTANPVAEASLVGFDYDSFTLNWTTNNAGTQIIHYLAIGGIDVLAKVQSFLAPGVVGNFAMTGVGFQPSVLLQIGSITVGGFDLTQGAVGFRMGAAVSASSRWCMSFLTAGAAGGVVPAWRWHRSDRFVIQTSTSGPPPSSEIDLVSMDPDGYTLNNLIGIASVHGILALKLPKVTIGTITKPIGSAPATRKVAGLGFSPSAVLLVGDQDIGRGNAASQTGGRIGISAITPAGAEASAFSLPNAASNISYAYIDKSNSAGLKVDNATPAVDAEAASATLDTDGFTLNWSPNDAVATDLGYVAFGPVRNTHDPVEIEAQLTPGNWVSLATDVMRPISVTYGINGAGPLDLVAGSGQLSFLLNNSETNSAGKLGYYSPESANVRSGFRIGTPVRLRIQQGGVVYYKFHGWIEEINPNAGKRGKRMTACVAVDWMDQAAQTKPTAVATQIGLRADQVAAAAIAAVSRQPLGGTAYQMADSTFPYAMDNSQSEVQPVLTEIQRGTQSEYGRAYMTGDGVFHWDKRTSRLTATIVAAFDDTMVKLTAAHRRARLVNRVKTTLHPRRVDSTTGTILFSNQSQPLVAPGATLSITGRYNDPNNRATRVGGKDFNAPVAVTDYTMNSAADGTGSDLTASFTVVAVYGANSVEYTIVNTGVVAGYVTKLQARGRGLYDYDAFDTVRIDQASVDSYGESLLGLDMPYQADSTVGQSVADYIVTTWAQPSAIELEMGVVAISNAQKAAVLAMEPCTAVTIRETVTGVASTFWVHRVTLQLESSRFIVADFLLQRAQIQSFWTLGNVGFSELGVTTVLAPL